MYKRGGHMRGVVSQRRPAPSPSPSSSSSPSLSSCPALSSNPQPLHVDGQHGRIGPSSDPQKHIRGQLGDMRTEFTSVSSPLVPSPSIPSPSVPSSSSVQHSNDEEDSRFMICPSGDSFTDATYVVRELNKIVNNSWIGQYISFNSAPKEVKNLWWNEFKRKFRWDEMEENEVRKIFKKKAGDHMRNMMNKAKRSQQKPNFITTDNWMEITRTWEIEKHKQISEQNKKNRASSFSEGSTSATYVGGSINIRENKKRMAYELGMESPFTATFEHTFQKKDKTWTSDRAKAIKAKYDELLISTASGGDGSDGVAASEPSINNMALWVEASGGMKGGKIFWMGSLSRAYTMKAAATSSSNAAVSRRTRHEKQMTQELSQLKHLLVQKDEELKQLLIQKDEELKHLLLQKYEELKHLLLQKDEEIRGMKQQMQLILRHLNLDYDEVPPVPPTNPIGDGHNDEPHNDKEIAVDDDNDFIVNLC